MKILCIVLLAVAIMNGSALNADTMKPAPVPAWEKTPVQPAGLTGKFSVHMPKYEGVDQLLLLSSRWIIIVTTDIDKVFDKINEISNGEFFKAIEKWEACDQKNKPDWNAFKARTRLRDKYLAQAREATGERKLDDPAYYSITGNDPRYKEAIAPTHVMRTIVGLGGMTAPVARQKLRGIGGVYYAHYSYIEMPHALENGREYTVALADGRKVTFIYDETRTISRAIKINQVGYLPSGSGNYAYLGAFLGEYGAHDFAFAKTFQVVSSETGEVVLTGQPKLRDKASRCGVVPGREKEQKAEDRPLINGEDVYELDLNGLKKEGTFFITIPGVGRSWPFRCGVDVYGEAFYVASRGYFHQRCGISLEQPYTQWKRIKCHTDPVYECGYVPFCAGAEFNTPKNYSVFDIIGGTISTRNKDGKPDKKDASALAQLPKTENVVGGWHDAADWDRNINHYSAVFDMLYAYQIAPRKFVDKQLNIPESGNGIPDLLDEAEFGIRVWKRSMAPDGGVSGMVETWTHPSIDDANVQYAFARRTRWSSLLFAAAAAQYAHLVKPFNEKLSVEYAEAAKKAYGFGSNPANSLGKTEIQARKNRGSGELYSYQWEEKDEMIRPFLCHAAMRLAILTGDKTYLDKIQELSNGVLAPFQWPNSFRDFSPWLYFDMATTLADKLPKELVEKWRKFYDEQASNLAVLSDRIPYRRTWPQYKDFWMGWGATSMCNYNRALFIADFLSANDASRRAAIQNMDFMFGANPMGICWTTGLGYVYPIDIQHANSENDGVLDPVPGITIYGLTGGSYPALRNQVWSAPRDSGSKESVDFVKPANRERPVWRRWSCHPHENVGQCEFTVHETMASTLFATAMLIPDGWMPSEELKQRGPRPDETLFGYYYLP